MVLHGLPNTVGVTMEMMILHGQAVMRGQPPRPGGGRHAVRLLRGSPNRAGLRQRRAHPEGDRRPGGEGRERPGGRRRPSPTSPGAACRSWATWACGPRRCCPRDGFRAKGRRYPGKASACRRGGGGRQRPARSPSWSRASPRTSCGADHRRRFRAHHRDRRRLGRCDGQILVTEDMLGLFEWTPKFVRRYGALRDDIAAAERAYAQDVGAGVFPAVAETYFAKG